MVREGEGQDLKKGVTPGKRVRRYESVEIPNRNQKSRTPGRNPFEKREISYAKYARDLPLGLGYNAWGLVSSENLCRSSVFENLSLHKSYFWS